MRFAAARGKPAHIFARGNNTGQQSRSQSTSVCNHRFQTTPLAARSHGYTAAKNKRQNARKNNASRSRFLPNRSPLQHSCSHYTAFPIITWQTCLYLRTWQQHRTTSPMQHSCSHYNRFPAWKTRLYLRTWQQKMTPMMLPFHCDLQPQVPNHPITTHTQTHPKQLEATVALRHVEIQESSDASRPQRYHLSSSFLGTSPSAAVKSPRTWCCEHLMSWVF